MIYKRALRPICLASTCLSTPAFAQIVAPSDIPPAVSVIDENGVDIARRTLNISYGDIAIGSGRMSYHFATSNTQQSDLGRGIKSSGSTYTVVIGGDSSRFTLTGTLGTGTFSSDDGQGETLTYDSASQKYTFTAHDGTVAVFSPVTNTLTYPDGEILSYVGKTHTSSLGYAMRNESSAKIMYNMAVDSCPQTTTTCTFSYNWPSATWDGVGNLKINGQTTVKYQKDSTNKVTLTYPSGRTITYTPDTTSGQHADVGSVTDGKGTWRYNYPSSYPGAGATLIFYPETPDSYPKTATYSYATGLVGAVSQAGANSIQINYDSFQRVSSATKEGVETNYTYDARGNVIKTLKRATAGGISDVVTTASYADTCLNPKTCNSPIYSIDPAGRRTDYTYDPAHGGVTSVTLPATAGGVRPQTRYGYTALKANFKDDNGVAISGAPVYRLTSISECRTRASCAGTSDEIKTTIVYDPNQALLPVSRTVGSGDGLTKATTAFSYYPTGDLKTVDGPLAGAEDTTRYYYDGARRLTGVIGPDPDGLGGPRKRAATKTTYDAEGRVTLTEIGTASDQGDSDLSTFATSQQIATSFDAQGRPSVSKKQAGGTTSAVQQMSYTNGGLLQCTATRMNTTAFASLPASACTLGAAGSQGPDRITSYSYDGPRRLTSVASGFGTPDQANDIQYTYDSNDNVDSVVDAAGNKTTYGYDPLGRLTKTSMPSLTAGSGTSSTSDYEQLTLDVLGNVTARRLRDGSVINYSYDGRWATLKDLPGTEPDVSFNYDLQGRPLSATQPGSSLTFTYDGLGRLKSESSPLETITSTIDLAGRETRLTWSDGYYVDYDYNVANQMTRVRENGATTGVGVLATYAYDDLGQLLSETYGNGATSILSYDPASRLGNLKVDLTGTAQDLSTRFEYNPAGQISLADRSNDSYAWRGHVNGTQTSQANGLNQIIANAGSTISYDQRGNLTGYGSKAFAYSSEDLLKSGPATTLVYDPMMRLAQISSSTSTRFSYNGSRLTGEYDGSGNLLRRYVYGAKSAVPIIWYEGAGTGDRRFLSVDERSSVIAASNSTGSVVGVNSYDEYGILTSGGLGRFRFAGLKWMPELELYGSDTRNYLPTIGRFMQTDPIGYGDGLNLYNYVGADPVNRIDPRGLAGQPLPEPPPPDLVQPDVIVTATRPDRPDFYYMPNSAAEDAARMLSFYQLPDGRGGNMYNQFAFASTIAKPKSQGQRRCTLAEARSYHNNVVNHTAEQYVKAGYLVAFNVSLRKISSGGASLRAVADFIATIPGSGQYEIHEIKTGDAQLSRNQRAVYDTGYLQVVGNSGLPVGLENNEIVPFVFVGEQRFRGCRP